MLVPSPAVKVRGWKVGGPTLIEPGYMACVAAVASIEIAYGAAKPGNVCFGTPDSTLVKFRFIVSALSILIAGTDVDAVLISLLKLFIVLPVTLPMARPVAVAP